MRRRRLFALLLAFALLAGTAAPARCAGQPTLVCETGETEGIISLALEGLDGGGVYGVQVELTLSGTYPRCVFTPDSRTAYSPDCLAESHQDSTTVTVYLTSRTPLNRGGTLRLGDLDLGTAGLVDWDVLPDTAGVLLLDQRLRPMSGDASGSLPVTATAPAGTPHTPAEDGDEPQLPGVPFTDVAPGDPYYAAVGYVYAHGMMTGTTSSTFSPQESITRGMIVTMFHRMEGAPAALPAAFTDVDPSAYYAAPVAWASASSIVTGLGNGLFAPETPITREQLAAILYRFAQYKELDVSLRADLGMFPDAPLVAPYAAGPMGWALATGVMESLGGRLEPGREATRAQVAVSFQRLCAGLLGMA